VCTDDDGTTHDANASSCSVAVGSRIGAVAKEPESRDDGRERDLLPDRDCDRDPDVLSRRL
jgi:hypothetical protein